MRPPPRLAELVLVAALVASGAWLRWCHLGTPSLWWDELVHIRIAEQPTVAAVWRTAREGAGPGTGNAGAVPLDYLALHAWLAVAPAPAPEAIERHYRMPAFLFAVAALPLAWIVGRMVGGPAGGTLALGLLATALPHVLYAAEARFYSLYVLATLANLAAFAMLVQAPSAGRLALFTGVSVAYVLSGLYGFFPIAAEYAVLAGLAWGRRGDERRWLGAAVASALVVAGALAAWLAPTAVTASYGRGTPAPLGLYETYHGTLLFFAGLVRPLAALFGAALLLAPVVARRDRVAGPVAIACLLAGCAPPLMVWIASGKQYYYHPRHALFLLPMVHVATACVLGRVVGRLVRPAPAAALAGAILAVATSAATVVDYVQAPLGYFQATKTLRDYRGLAQAIAARTADQPPGPRYELLLARGRPGHLANPTLAFYLDAYGLTERVMLGGIDDPTAVLRKLPAACPGGCRGPSSVDTLVSLGVGDPFDQPRLMRRLMQIRVSTWSATMAGIGLVAWTPNVPVTTPPGVVATRFEGLALYDVDERGTR